MYEKLSNHCLVDGILGWHDSRGRVIVLDAEGVGPTQTPDAISKCLWTIVLLMMCHGGKAGDKQKLIFRVFIMEYCTFSLVPLGKVRWGFSLDHPCSPWRRCTARGIQQSKHQTSISVLSTLRLSKYIISKLEYLPCLRGEHWKPIFFYDHFQEWKRRRDPLLRSHYWRVKWLFSSSRSTLMDCFIATGYKIRESMPIFLPVYARFYIKLVLRVQT